LPPEKRKTALRADIEKSRIDKTCDI